MEYQIQHQAQMDKLSLICTYCGFESDLELDHVIPVAYLGSRKWDSSKQWIVNCCRQCNMFAGASYFGSIPDKARFIAKRYKSKFAKILRFPSWTQEDIEELSYTLRQGISESVLFKNMVKRRIDYLERIAELPDNYLRPKWIEDIVRDWQDKIKIKKRYDRNYRRRKIQKKAKAKKIQS